MPRSAGARPFHYVALNYTAPAHCLIVGLEQGSTENSVLHATIDEVVVGVSMHLWMHFDTGDFVVCGAGHVAFALDKVAGFSGVIFFTFIAKFRTHTVAPQAHRRDRNTACTSTLKFCLSIQVSGQSDGVDP